jgi:hypothetical protein
LSNVCESKRCIQPTCCQYLLPVPAVVFLAMCLGGGGRDVLTRMDGTTLCMVGLLLLLRLLLLVRAVMNSIAASSVLPCTALHCLVLPAAAAAHRAQQWPILLVMRLS